MNRGPGDNAKVSVLLNDYEDADRVLVKVLLTLVSYTSNAVYVGSSCKPLLIFLNLVSRSLKTRNHGKSHGTTSSPPSLTSLLFTLPYTIP